MKKFVISSVAVASFAFAFVANAAVTASEIYTPATGFLRVGSGMGAKVSQSANVIAAQKALNACTGSTLALDGKFGPLTKGSFMAFQASKGVKVDGIIGPVTAAQLAACSGTTPTTPTTPGTLNGGAGVLDLSSTSTDVESDVEEGATEKVLGIEAEADGSDIAVTNVKVTLSTATTSGSTRIEKYIDEVSVWLGDKEVGSVDADEFSKNGTTYSKNITLSGAKISEDDKENLYVGIKALSSVDDENATINVSVSEIRYTDGTGAILIDSYTDSETFGFDAEGVKDELSIKSSSKNPEASTIKIKENDKSDDMLVLAFNLEADDDSSDINVMDMPITIDLTGTSATLGSVINEVYAKVGSKEFKADRITAATATTGTYNVEFDDDFVIDSGDKEEVEIYVVFNKQDGNYAIGSTIKATVDSDTILAEGADDLTASQLNGMATGKVHTLNTAVANVSGISWNVPAAGSLINFYFTVEAEEDDVTVDLASIVAIDTINATATVAAPVLTKVSGDATEVTAGSVYTVQDGDEARFEVRYAVSGTNGQYANVTITSVEGTKVSTSLERSPDAVLNVQ